MENYYLLLLRTKDATFVYSCLKKSLPEALDWAAEHGQNNIKLFVHKVSLNVLLNCFIIYYLRPIEQEASISTGTWLKLTVTWQGSLDFTSLTFLNRLTMERLEYITYYHTFIFLC